MRKKVIAVQKQLDSENIPMKVFEAFRAPERQNHLYQKGRTTSGSIVSNARAWQSYHQYGMAADFVRFENGKWNWNTSPSSVAKQWDRFHEIARENGLEPLSWEKPHVQLIGTSFSKLLNGDYPEGGDESWADNLEAAILRWPGTKKPPVPNMSERPPMSPPVVFGGEATAPAADWHSMFDGDSWKNDHRGIFTLNHDGTEKLWRTPGSPLTVQEIVARYGHEIAASAAKYKVPAAIIVMTIATETGRYRAQGFTGPKTFRWEKAYVLRATGDANLDGKEKGDYSAGPMQVLSDTARWMNTTYDLKYSSSDTLKYFKNKPSKSPENLGLYDAATCIDIGTAFIAHNKAKTGMDPLLVSAAYNAGSLRPTSENHWRIHCHGNHLDRAAEWYGDACFVLNGV